MSEHKKSEKKAELLEKLYATQSALKLDTQPWGYRQNNVNLKGLLNTLEDQLYTTKNITRPVGAGVSSRERGVQMDNARKQFINGKLKFDKLPDALKVYYLQLEKVGWISLCAQLVVTAHGTGTGIDELLWDPSTKTYKLVEHKTGYVSRGREEMLKQPLGKGAMICRGPFAERPLVDNYENRFAIQAAATAMMAKVCYEIDISGVYVFYIDRCMWFPVHLQPWYPKAMCILDAFMAIPEEEINSCSEESEEDGEMPRKRRKNVRQRH